MSTMDRSTKRPRSRARGALWPILAAGLLVVATVPEPALASPWPAGADDEASSLDEGEPGDDLRQTIEIYMLARMKRTLDLTAEQEEELVPLVQDLSAARQRFRRERRLALMRLRPLAEDPSASESTLRTELSRLEGSQEAFHEEESMKMDRIREVLTTRQEAQFVLFVEQFMHDMQRRLRQMRQLHGQVGPAPERGGPGPRRRGSP